MVLHDKELAFFIENHKELTRAGYTPEDCCLYGEIGFLMLRLKPLVKQCEYLTY